VRVNGDEAPSLILLASLLAPYMAFGRRYVRFDVLAVVAFAVMLALFAFWHLPQISDTVGRRPSGSRSTATPRPRRT